MNNIYFGIAGTVLQSLCLAAFILISRTSFAQGGKLVVIGLTIVSVVMLLWYGVRRVKTRLNLFLLPVLLALGYSIAFHLVGVLGFHGLLMDWDISTDYFMSVLRVTSMVFAMYSIVTAVLYLVNRAIQKNSLL